MTDEAAFYYGECRDHLDEALNAWTGTLEKVFPTKAGEERKKHWKRCLQGRQHLCMQPQGCKAYGIHSGIPGNQLRIRQHKAFERAGAKVDDKVFRILSAEDIRESVETLRSLSPGADHHVPRRFLCR